MWFKKKYTAQTNPNLIDVYLTTHRRADLLSQTLPVLLQAIEHSPFQHRFTVLVDAMDQETLGVLKPHLTKINLVSTGNQLGLPFMFNMIHDFSKNQIARTEIAPALICYLQDDCLINFPHQYFSVIYKTYFSVLPSNKTGFISGFYSPLHPGFEKAIFDGFTLIKSDTIDGKNLVTTPTVFQSIGPLSWRNMKNEKRGNPGPIGSGFDLWQWRDAPNCTMKQKRINLIIPGLVETIGMKNSTWGNDGDETEVIAQRLASGKFYKTRPTIAEITSSDYFKP
jgi:hypothetical protein